jgi:hypothetical protein
MGGIVVIEPETISDNQTRNSAHTKRESTILTLELLEYLMEDPEFELTISQKEIEDKAKGDFLSKSIVVFQTTWFITQCVAPKDHNYRT